MQIQTDSRGVDFVEWASNIEELPTGWLTCETCDRAWDNAKISRVTPTTARCPFEYYGLEHLGHYTY